MDYDFHSLEQQRRELQNRLDKEKTKAERNEMGQFATPFMLAQEMLRYAEALLPPGPFRFLDPAFGTGAFYSALGSLYPNGRVVEAAGFEIDPHYGRPAETLWGKSGLVLHLEDFTHRKPDPRFDLLICNPPYVRHHHLTTDEKARLRRRTAEVCGIHVSGLAGLYCHFLGLSHAWLADGAVAGWLIPSEFMDVNYGAAIRQYLLEKVSLLHIHRFDPLDAQFTDALVSSAIVWYRKAPPASDHAVTFSFGGSLANPVRVRVVPAQSLALEAKWTRFPDEAVRPLASVPTLGDFFRIKRGIATGNNRFFILPEEEIKGRGLPMEAFRSILPGSRYVDDEIEADDVGDPRIARRLYVLDLRMNEDEIARRMPSLWQYLEEGKSKGVHEAYLCRHRNPWYAQEDRPAAPLICTYLGRADSRRGRPFRFILNQSRATVANVYLAMYPTPLLARAMGRDARLMRKIWRALNQLPPERLLGEGRVYGGGLHKLEPRELAKVPVGVIAELLPSDVRPARQESLPGTAR